MSFVISLNPKSISWKSKKISSEIDFDTLIRSVVLIIMINRFFIKNETRARGLVRGTVRIKSQGTPTRLTGANPNKYARYPMNTRGLMNLSKVVECRA